MKKLNAILLAAGLGFLVYLVWRLGPVELGHQLSALGWGVVLMVLIEGAANLAHTAGWRHCLRQSGERVSLWRLFRINMSGWAINYLTPTASVGGEVSRAALLSASYKGAEAVSSVLLDKLMTGVAHVLLVVLGSLLLFWRVHLPLPLWIAMAVTTLLLTAGLGTFFFLQKHGKLGALCRWLVEHKLGGRAAETAAEQLSKVDEALKRFYREHPLDLVQAVVWHLLGHLAALLHAWVFLLWLKQPAPLATVTAAGFLSLWFDLLTFAVPMNLGALEGSRIAIFKALGCEALLGMTFGIAIRLTQLFWAGFGLVSYAFMAARRSPQTRNSPPAPLADGAASGAELPPTLQEPHPNEP